MKITNVIAAIGAVCVVGAGCASSPGGSEDLSTMSGPKPPAPIRDTLIGFDRSKSTEKTRAQFLGTTFNIGTSFDPIKDTMRLFRFGSTTEEFYSGLPEDDDAFAQILVQHVKESDPVPGTDYPQMLTVMADSAEQSTAREIRIIVIGDGENDFKGDPAYDKRYRAAAARLAHNPKIKWVRFWGVSAGTFEDLRSVFAPLVRQGKFQILTTDKDPLVP